MERSVCTSYQHSAGYRFDAAPAFISRFIKTPESNNVVIVSSSCYLESQEIAVR